MKEIISYLDDIGHALGIGGIEGLLGAPVVILAFLVIVVQLLRGTTQINERRGKDDGQWENHLQCIDKEFDEMIYNTAYDNLPCNIWHKKDK